MKGMQDVMIKCPFYKREERQKIICEGMWKGSATHLAFDTPAKMKAYKKEYCNGDYEKCGLCSILYDKYEYEV